MFMRKRKSTTFKIIFATLAVTMASTLADRPDLTKGDKPKGPGRITLGPTGMQGWIHYSWKGGPEELRTGGSRQILVEKVEEGSPADGIIQPGDVILGANGTGAPPLPFSSDARKSFGYAIADAEARDPAILNMRIWRSGLEHNKSITLKTMGAYSPTAPYNCPKSEKILEQGLAHLFKHEDSGFQNFGLLALLSSTNPDHLARAREEAHALIPTPEKMEEMLAGIKPDEGKVVWGRGYALVTLAEYYLATGDKTVLPAIEARAVEFARNQSMFGTTGHKFANKKEDGSDNGPMGGHYGVVNNTALMGLLGLTLARECGIDNPYIQQGIDRAARFYAHYAVGSKIPYGEHHSWRPDGFSSNGKPATAALAMAHLPKWVDACRYYSKWCTAAHLSRESGHTGPYFEYVWAILGAAVGGEEAAASYFRRISWHLDLMRHWDGSFSYDVARDHNTVGGQYGPFTATSDLLLTYALPRRALYITGAKTYERNLLSSKDVKEAEFSSDYVTTDRTIKELIRDLGDWCPITSVKAAQELATRKEATKCVDVLIEIATRKSFPRDLRAGVCDALSQIDDKRGLPVLVGLLTDEDNYVRRTAAQSLRFMSGREEYVEDILKAVVKLARPLRPFDEEDPMHLDVMNVSMLLFFSGRAAGPRGILGKSIDGIDKNLLYEAVKAIAYTPNGRGRSCLDNVYSQFSKEDLYAVAKAVVDSVQNQSPADKMFSSGVRTEGLKLLERNHITEGIPLSLEVHDLAPELAMDILKKYGSACLEVNPDPEVVSFLQDQVGGPPPIAPGLYAERAINALQTITNGAPPRELTALKRIESIGADDDTILPTKTIQTTLRAVAHDHAEGDLIYTWRKVHGASDITFTPNGTASSANTQITFNRPGLHRFEVTLSDERGLTQISTQTVVTVYDQYGRLPANRPPQARPQEVSGIQNTPLPITLQGIDPDGLPLTFTVIDPPKYGTLTGSDAQRVYTPNLLYKGQDRFTFKAIDSEGETSTSMVGITIKPAPRNVRVYEPFDYADNSKKHVDLDGKGGTSDMGFDAVWSAGRGSYIHPYELPIESMSFQGGTLQLGGRNPCSRSISPKALSEAGLLENGATLWMSFALGLHENANAANTKFYLALATDALERDRIRPSDDSGGYGVGITATRAIVQAASFAHDKDPLNSDYEHYANLGTGTPYLCIVKFTWGASPTAEDKIEVYTPGRDLSKLDEPISVHKTIIDQTTLDTLTFSFKNKLILDEIRMGPDLISVVP